MHDSTVPAYLARARVSVSGYFATAGFVMGAWAAGLPSLDDRLSLGEARIGTALLTIAAAGVLTMLVVGRLCDRYGSRGVARVAGPISALTLLAPTLAPGYPTLLACAAVYGIGVGLIEVSMNVNSVELEVRYGRPIVSAFHGLWSLGGAIAGALTAAGLWLGSDARAVMAMVVVTGAAMYYHFGKRLLPSATGAGATSDVASRVAPSLGLLLVGAVAVLAFAGHLSEGGAVDWANIHADRVLSADPALAPLSYTVFGVAMTVMRLSGDPIRARLGPIRTLLLAGITATFGYCLVLASGAVGGIGLAWAGWTCTGTGLAIVIPVLFSAVGTAGGTGRDVAVVSIAGSVGFVAGPASIGYTAELTSLTVGLLIPAALAAAVAILGPVAIRAMRLDERNTSATAPEPVAADHG